MSDFIARKYKNQSLANISVHDWQKIDLAYRSLSDLDVFGIEVNESAINLDNEFDELWLNVTPKDFIESCIIYGTEYKDCLIFFNKIISRERLCHAFNHLSPKGLFNKLV